MAITEQQEFSISIIDIMLDILFCKINGRLVQDQGMIYVIRTAEDRSQI